MKYFAKLDAANKVVAIHHIEDDVAPTEQAGIDFLNTTYKTNDVWKQSFQDGSQRKHAASPGFIYDESRDAFIDPQPPYPSWNAQQRTLIKEISFSKRTVGMVIMQEDLRTDVALKRFTPVL
jgi:hypothetical protein